jgi:D-tyrosyl-tRNA(Tyr) deacylase
MKYIIVGLIAVIGVGGTAYAMSVEKLLDTQVVEYVAPVVEKKEVDVLEEARTNLSETTRKLKEEEDRLKAEIAVREARIKEINEIKLSF